MTESVLKTLLELLAFVCRANGVEPEEEKTVSEFLAEIAGPEKTHLLLPYFRERAYPASDDLENGRMSIKGSIYLIGLCQNLNNELDRLSKYRLLITLFELVIADGEITPIERDMIEAVAEAFNLPYKEMQLLESLVFDTNPYQSFHEGKIILSPTPPPEIREPSIKLNTNLEGDVVVVFLRSSKITFIKNYSRDSLWADQQEVVSQKVSVFPHGSILKNAHGQALLFQSEVLKYFRVQELDEGVTLQVREASFSLPNGQQVISPLSFEEESGKLVGIMGPSGSGKSTLLQLLAGIRKPSKGEVRLNGLSVSDEIEETRGYIGFVPQHDLLIGGLTVLENLLFSGGMVFNNISQRELRERCLMVLGQLGIAHTAHKLVGNLGEPGISGGERKRANMAIELLRSPQVLLLDEPTSGLSSRDSRGIIDILKSLSLEGTLVITVIHQPSAEVFKTLDRLLVLDMGGLLVYYGLPQKAYAHFAKHVSLDAEMGERRVADPAIAHELIFDLIDARTVDENGTYTTQRKVEPRHWHNLFKQLPKPKPLAAHYGFNKKGTQLANWFKQVQLYFNRDLRAKSRNKAYILLNILTAPILGCGLALLNKYSSMDVFGVNQTYSFFQNPNIPAYYFMSVIVALFLGLSVSATEIISERQLLKRERYIGLSSSAFLVAKSVLLLALVAFMMLTYTLIGSWILEIAGLNTKIWVILFTAAASSVFLGLYLSAWFRTAVGIYIVIPILLIPQIVLGGAVIPFEKLNNVFRRGNLVPTVAEFMPSRWAFEAIMLAQWQARENHELISPTESAIANADFRLNFLYPYLTEINPNSQEGKRINLIFSLTWLKREAPWLGVQNSREVELVFKSSGYKATIQRLTEHWRFIRNKAYQEQENLQARLSSSKQQSFQNEAVNKLVKNKAAEQTFLIGRYDIFPMVSPCFFRPEPRFLLDFRSPFYSAEKQFGGLYFSTPRFNLLVLVGFALFFAVLVWFKLKQGRFFFVMLWQLLWPRILAKPNS